MQQNAHSCGDSVLHHASRSGMQLEDLLARWDLDGHGVIAGRSFGSVLALSCVGDQLGVHA